MRVQSWILSMEHVSTEENEIDFLGVSGIYDELDFRQDRVSIVIQPG